MFGTVEVRVDDVVVLFRLHATQKWQAEKSCRCVSMCSRHFASDISVDWQAMNARFRASFASPQGLLSHIYVAHSQISWVDTNNIVLALVLDIVCDTTKPSRARERMHAQLHDSIWSYGTSARALHPSRAEVAAEDLAVSGGLVGGGPVNNRESTLSSLKYTPCIRNIVWLSPFGVGVGCRDHVCCTQIHTWHRRSVLLT